MIGSSGWRPEWHAKGVDMAFYHIDDIGIGAMYIALKEMKAKGGPVRRGGEVAAAPRPLVEADRAGDVGDAREKIRRRAAVATAACRTPPCW
jgi:hypothetical protein